MRHPDLEDVGELRARFAGAASHFAPLPAGIAVEPGQAGPVRGEWLKPESADRNRLILYMHGGGYISGSPESYRPLIARLCRTAQARAFVPSYRLAPEYPFPAGLRDALDAYRNLLSRYSAQTIVLAGDGAGGGLAFACLLAIRNGNLPMPGACVAMSPWADLSLSGWSILQNARSDTLHNWEMLFVAARHYLKRQNPADPYASPVFASFRDFPPLMVHAGSQEILRDDSSRLGERAAEAGVPVSVEIYDGMQHLFQAMPGSEAEASLERLGRFIRSHTAIQPARRAASG